MLGSGALIKAKTVWLCNHRQNHFCLIMGGSNHAAMMNIIKQPWQTTNMQLIAHAFIYTAPRRITAAQLKRLDEIGLCYTPLCTMRKRCSSEASSARLSTTRSERQALTTESGWNPTEMIHRSFPGVGVLSFLSRLDGFQKPTKIQKYLASP